MTRAVGVTITVLATLLHTVWLSIAYIYCPDIYIISKKMGCQAHGDLLPTYSARRFVTRLVAHA